MKRLARLGFVASLALAAVAAPSYADWTANPSSGPPGTVVTVNVVPCEGPTTFMLSFIRGHQSLGPTVPFTPPTGTIVVPDVPDGEYGIFVNCGAGESFVPFAVRATPGFTG